MIAEFLTASATLASGALALRAAGLRGWGVVPVGYLVGTSLLVLVVTFQATFALPTAPVVSLSVTALMAGLAWLVALRRGWGLPIELPVAAAVVGALVPLIWLFRAANLARVTPDSFSLIMSGALLHRDRLDLAGPEFLEDWQVASGAIHGASHLNGELYLASASPLAALATVGALVWLVERALTSVDVARRTVVAVAFLAGAALLTTQRFLFHAFYLNRHVVIAGLVLVACVAGWGLVRGTIAPPTASFVLLATVLPGLVLGRAETPLVAGLVLLPVLVAGSVPRRQRAALAGILGGTVALWNGGLVGRYAGSDLPVSGSSVVMLLLGVAALGYAVLVARGTRTVDPLPRWVLLATEAALWLAVLAGAVVMPDVLSDSLANTVENVVLGEGGWGVTLPVIVLLVLLVAAATREGDRVQLRLPMTAFLPLALTLAYVRHEGGLAYRVGTSDSLNRMLLHFLPLALFYVATTACAAVRRRSGPRAATTAVSAARTHHDLSSKD
jgi:hypothetical protein